MHTPIEFQDLTLDEQGLIAAIRRVEAHFGKDRAQLVLFVGTEVDVLQVQDALLDMAAFRDSGIKGFTHLLAIHVPEDESLAEMDREAALDRIEDLFEPILGELEGYEEEDEDDDGGGPFPGAY
jgi:hypothetical protein